MISKFGTPSICVIDDDPLEYEPILDALKGSWLGWVHIKGDESSRLPPKPFSGLRLVFTDLYLTGDSPTNAISRTVQVFRKVVSPETGPVVVVIWSKHSGDQDSLPGVPKDDQPTQADKFMATLLSTEQRYRDRLVFHQMPKPVGIRSGKKRKAWISGLRKQIETLLEGKNGLELLWAWEALARNVTLQMSADITALAQRQQESASEPDQFDADLQKLFVALSGAHGGYELDGGKSLRHFMASMSEALADRIEHSIYTAKEIKKPRDWLTTKGKPREAQAFGPKLNTLLLTAKVSKDDLFLPGMVYRVTNTRASEKYLCATWLDLLRKIANHKGPGALPDWTRECIKVMVEVSQPCDVQHNNRKLSVLVGGFIVPGTGKPSSGFGQDPNGANYRFPAKFTIDVPGSEKNPQEVLLYLSANYKCMVNPKGAPSWLRPWFRFREVPATTIRVWQASHMARVGFFSV